MGVGVGTIINIVYQAATWTAVYAWLLLEQRLLMLGVDDIRKVIGEKDVQQWTKHTSLWHSIPDR